jgi:hypothetical protein
LDLTGKRAGDFVFCEATSGAINEGGWLIVGAVMVVQHSFPLALILTHGDSDSTQQQQQQAAAAAATHNRAHTTTTTTTASINSRSIRV